MKLKLYSVLIGASAEGLLLGFWHGLHGCPSGWGILIGLLYLASRSPVEALLVGALGADKTGAESMAIAVVFGFWVIVAYLMLRFMFRISDGASRHQ